MTEKTLNQMATKLIGDGCEPNLFFVSDYRGNCLTVTANFDVAYSHWKELANSYPRRECNLEDRKNGTLASIETDETGLLMRYDDTHWVREA